MGMVVRTNTMAQNANRQLSINNTAVGKSLEKLSSGFRINRAADDASGLAISEKMKSQIKGLEQASANSQDGISLIQTAEGATQEIHNMLNRMVELATKSANGTIQDDVDRAAITREVEDLNAEITRIADSTNFNGIKLLNGELGGAAAAAAAAAGTGAPTLVEVTGTIGGTQLSSQTTAATEGKFVANDPVAAGTEFTNYKIEVAYTDADGISQTKEVAFEAGANATATGSAIATAINADTVLKDIFVASSNTGTLTFTNKTAGKTDIPAVTGIKHDLGGGGLAAEPGAATAGTDLTMVTATLKNNTTLQAGDKITIDGKDYTFAATADGKDGKTFKDVATLIAAAKVNDITLTIDSNGASATKAAAGGGGGTGTPLQLQVGDTNDAHNHVEVSVANLSAIGIGTDAVDVSNQTAAGAAIKIINDAINTVSTNRANLGSLQNRLEYTINNLDTTAENMTAANSRIRDTDMAKEMMSYTKMNILTQSAQAMLAQANQQPQAILQLLQ